jgi:hypothetical protein
MWYTVEADEEILRSISISLPEKGVNNPPMLYARYGK